MGFLWRKRAGPEGSRALAIKLRICSFCSDDVTQQNRKSRVCSKVSPPLSQEGNGASCSVGSGNGDTEMGLGVHALPCLTPVVQILQDRARKPLQCHPSSFLSAGISLAKLGAVGVGQEGLVPSCGSAGFKGPTLQINTETFSASKGLSAIPALKNVTSKA